MRARVRVRACHVYVCVCVRACVYTGTGAGMKRIESTGNPEERIKATTVPSLRLSANKQKKERKKKRNRHCGPKTTASNSFYLFCVPLFARFLYVDIRSQKVSHIFLFSRAFNNGVVLDLRYETTAFVHEAAQSRHQRPYCGFHGNRKQKGVGTNGEEIDRTTRKYLLLGEKRLKMADQTIIGACFIL